MKLIATAFAFAAIAIPACAQESVPSLPDPAGSRPSSPSPACCLIPAGTIVDLELAEEISSKSNARGDRFRLSLARSIVIDGQTVVPAGAFGVGEVIDAAPAGKGGKPGELLLAARYIKAGDIEIPVRGFKLSAHGLNESKDAQTAVLLVGVLGLAIRGGDKVMHPGEWGVAKVVRDVTIPTQPPPPLGGGHDQEGNP